MADNKEGSLASSLYKYQRMYLLNVMIHAFALNSINLQEIFLNEICAEMLESVKTIELTVCHLYPIVYSVLLSWFKE